MTTIDIYEVAREAIRLADANPTFVYERPELVVDNEDIFEGPEAGTFVTDDGYPVTKEDGDCKYVHHAKSDHPEGGCIFGQALINKGMLVGDLLPFEGTGIAAVVEPTKDFWAYSSLANAMASVQQNQDSGEAWGEAIQPLKHFFAAREVAVVSA